MPVINIINKTWKMCDSRENTPLKIEELIKKLNKTIKKSLEITIKRFTSLFCLINKLAIALLFIS
tara:strand:+ start:203 stop:397 length:195 start_codon:yes stop_codon:yes gene_type:complete